MNFIPRSASNADLKAAFLQFGDIEDAFIITDIKKNNSSLGYGFVIFKKILSAENAIKRGSLLLGENALQICSYKKGGQRNVKEPKFLKQNKPCMIRTQEPSPITENMRAQPRVSIDAEEFSLDNLNNSPSLRDSPLAPEPV